jgi:ankyrin repeat protein
VPELPDKPDLDWLRKQAKRRLDDLRRTDPEAQLADAQFALAKDHGFASWRALKAHIDSLTIDGQLFEAARQGDAIALARLLDAHPDKLHVRAKPYGMTLLHLAAQDLASVELLVARGIDVNARDTGDNSYAMHWAAAAGTLAVVRRLADAGGDVVGHGDDHGLEVIGWATCWPGCDDDAHRAVADFLISRGARHHIFSAIALDLDGEVRRIVADDPSAFNHRQSRNESHRTPLHFALVMKRPRMIELLLELGADPLAVDGDGQPVAIHASEPSIDRAVMKKIRAMTQAELLSAARGNRPPRSAPADLMAMLALGDWSTAAHLVDQNASLLAPVSGVLHMMAKRNDTAAVRWLLDRGADANGMWAHWDADVTPLHLAAMQGHAEVAQLLLDAGANTSIRDSKHDSDPRGWAEFFEKPAIVAMIDGHTAKRQQ